MNHLAHLLLAERSNGLLVGGFLGDFVKGRLKGDRPTAIEQGIKLHRYIDHFTDHHPEALGLRALFPDSTRKIAGIALDLMFDHQLALEFTKWHPEALEVFERRVFVRLLANEHAPYFPQAALAQCQAMSARLSLSRTVDPEFLSRSLSGVKSRLRNGQALITPSTIRQIQSLEPAILLRFDAFFGSLIEAVDAFIAGLPLEEQTRRNQPPTVPTL